MVTLYVCIPTRYNGHTDTLYVCIPTRYNGHTLCVYTYQIILYGHTLCVHAHLPDMMATLYVCTPT